MAKESGFVEEALAAAQKVLRPPLMIRRGSALLYEVTVDNNLLLTVDPRPPVRGDSAFQTDLCVFEEKSSEVKVPRVVLEFKTVITTHDVITYSAKARKHKQVYPYLRYGLIASQEAVIPRRFFIHNESIDFFAAVRGRDASGVQELFSSLLAEEAEASRRLERIAFGKALPDFFRTEIRLSPEPSP